MLKITDDSVKDVSNPPKYILSATDTFDRCLAHRASKPLNEHSLMKSMTQLRRKFDTS